MSHFYLKKVLVAIAVFLSFKIAAQFNVVTLNIKANDLVYDKVTDRIYACLAPSNGSVGNSIGVINPNTYSLELTIPIGSDPNVMAISDDGQKIYVGFSGSSTVRKFDVPSLTPEIQFSLGNDQFFGPLFAEDIEVLPGNPNSIAVSRMVPGFSPRHQGVAIYDNGVIRTATTQSHTGSNKIEFLYPTGLIGINNETTEFGLRTITVTPAGVSQTGVFNNMVPGFSQDFILWKGKAYMHSGRVVDCTLSPFIAGQFSGVSGPVAFDSTQNKVCYLNNSWMGSNVTFKRFNPTNFNIVDSMYIPQATSFAKRLITCGLNRYTFNTDNNVIFLQTITNPGMEEFSSIQDISFYPNPAKDQIYLNSSSSFSSIKIFDLNGRTVLSPVPNSREIDLKELEKGMYVLLLQKENGSNHTFRFVKD